jgi:hypothetical protein
MMCVCVCGARRLEMCYKRGVAESIPHLPLDPVFEHSNYFREFLITKRACTPCRLSVRVRALCTRVLT